MGAVASSTTGPDVAEASTPALLNVFNWTPAYQPGCKFLYCNRVKFRTLVPS